jgi:hypothetical protein
MAIWQNTKATVIKFVLIIVISACIAGIVGGVTSQVSKFKAATVVQTPTNWTGNGTVKGVRMVRRMWIG